ncbi:hypothetical protein CDD83_1719 [Cordyceps sp. RAO-2017]|nr:hypothetical protein CDD83_1719 [Cordyceps sp. RAO-2017]
MAVAPPPPSPPPERRGPSLLARSAARMSAARTLVNVDAPDAVHPSSTPREAMQRPRRPGQAPPLPVCPARRDAASADRPRSPGARHAPFPCLAFLARALRPGEKQTAIARERRTAKAAAPGRRRRGLGRDRFRRRNFSGAGAQATSQTDDSTGAANE